MLTLQDIVDVTAAQAWRKWRTATVAAFHKTIGYGGGALINKDRKGKKII